MMILIVLKLHNHASIAIEGAELFETNDQNISKSDVESKFPICQELAINPFERFIRTKKMVIVK